VALARLDEMGVLYPCFCTRAEIKQEIENSQSAPHGPEGVLYPGTCRNLSLKEREMKISTKIPYALRLNTKKALQFVRRVLSFKEKGGNIRAQPETLGDVVLARKEIPTSYHLSVVFDDHLQGITHIIRGEDLFHATHIHCLLQILLGFRTPEYHHHLLLAGPDGHRLAKRDKALTLQSLRQEGKTIPEIEDLMESYGGKLGKLPF